MCADIGMRYRFLDVALNCVVIIEKYIAFLRDEYTIIQLNFVNIYNYVDSWNNFIELS